MKAQVSTIQIDRAEGTIGRDTLHPVNFNSWDDAESFLFREGRTAPEPGEGYDKTDVTIAWSNGCVLKGRFDLQRGGLSDGQTLRRYVLNTLKFASGDGCPTFMPEESYRRILHASGEATQKKCKNILDTCEIPA